MGLSLAPVLSRQEINTFHERSLDLLEKVGIDYKTPKALQVLEKFGCPVDYKRTWASLPREVVEWALQQAPRVVKLAARDPDRDIVLPVILTEISSLMDVVPITPQTARELRSSIWNRGSCMIQLTKI
jgi:trimethylamine:corrinoid methyltransferase-like protein